MGRNSEAGELPISESLSRLRSRTASARLSRPNTRSTTRSTCSGPRRTSAPDRQSPPWPICSASTACRRASGRYRFCTRSRSRSRRSRSSVSWARTAPGKSTLFNIITGVVRPDAGTMRLKGQTVTSRAATPRPIAAGVSRVFQEQALIGNVPVYAEPAPVAGGRFTRFGQWLDKRAMIEVAQAIVDDAGLDVDVRRPDRFLRLLQAPGDRDRPRLRGAAPRHGHRGSGGAAGRADLGARPRGRDRLLRPSQPTEGQRLLRLRLAPADRDPGALRSHLCDAGRTTVRTAHARLRPTRRPCTASWSGAAGRTTTIISSRQQEVGRPASRSSSSRACRAAASANVSLRAFAPARSSGSAGCSIRARAHSVGCAAGVEAPASSGSVALDGGPPERAPDRQP